MKNYILCYIPKIRIIHCGREGRRRYHAQTAADRCRAGAGAVFAAGILPSGNGQDRAADTLRKRHSGSDRRFGHHGSGERQGAGNAAGDLCGRRDGGRDCGRFSG